MLRKVSARWLTWAAKRIGTFDLETGAFLGFFLIGLFLAWPRVFPGIGALNPADETEYISRGRYLFAGGPLPLFSQNPFLALLYSLATLPFRSSLFWLTYAARLGHFILFCMLWAAVYLVAKGAPAPGLAPLMGGLFALSGISTALLRNSSDAAFTAFSGLAFWQWLTWYKTRKRRHLLILSLFCVMAAFSRNDGLVLCPAVALLVALTPLVSQPASPRRQIARDLIVYLAPFVVLVGGYQALYWRVTGESHVGVLERSYGAFEQGQGVIFADQYQGNPYEEGIPDARRYFGTPQENHYLVPVAVLRNPPAFLARVQHLALLMPNYAITAYGGRVCLITFLLALIGVASLLRQGQRGLILGMTLWLAPLLTYFAFFFRTEYLLLPFFIVLLAAAIGALQLVLSPGAGLVRWPWLLVGIPLALWGLAKNTFAWFEVGLLFSAFFLFLYGAPWRNDKGPRALDSVFALAIIFTTLSLPPPESGRLLDAVGGAPVEKAAVWVRANLPAGSRVAAYSSQLARIVDLGEVSLIDVPGSPSQSVKEQTSLALSWLGSQGASVIYVDQMLKGYRPLLWQVFSAQKTNCFPVLYQLADEAWIAGINQGCSR